jgi:hypothetical protein
MNESWWQWLFFLPGNAFVARFGATDLGVGWVSALLWLAALAAVIYLPGLLLDAVDPTYRQQRRERREAQKRMARKTRGRGKPGSRLRIEPTLKG